MPELPKQAPKNRHHFNTGKATVMQRFLEIYMVFQCFWKTSLRQREQSVCVMCVFWCRIFVKAWTLSSYCVAFLKSWKYPDFIFSENCNGLMKRCSYYTGFEILNEQECFRPTRFYNVGTPVCFARPLLNQSGVIMEPSTDFGWRFVLSKIKNVQWDIWRMR